jgi:hypothetical protein
MTPLSQCLGKRQSARCEESKGVSSCTKTTRCEDAVPLVWHYQGFVEGSAALQSAHCSRGCDLPLYIRRWDFNEHMFPYIKHKLQQL